MKCVKKGFTLIEIIICLAIVGITGVFLAGFLGPNIRVFDAQSQQARNKTVCTSVLNFIQDKIEYAKDFSVTDGVLSYTAVTKEEETPNNRIDGKVYANALYPEYGRKDQSIQVSFEIADTGVLVTVSVLDLQKEKTVYTLTQSIYCPNVVQTVPEKP